MENKQKQAIKELAELLHANNLSEIDYEENGVHIRIVGPKQAHTELIAPVSAPLPAVQTATPVPAVVENKPVVKAENNIVSPMVGIVYLQKSPSEPPFVKVGDTIKVGDTVCLVEAMKTFNPIKATKSGVVSAVLVESGNPVEFNQPLFTLE